jgi:hypothetical protein
LNIRLHSCFADIPLGTEVHIDTIPISLVFWQIRREAHRRTTRISADPPTEGPTGRAYSSTPLAPNCALKSSNVILSYSATMYPYLISCIYLRPTENILDHRSSPGLYGEHAITSPTPCRTLATFCQSNSSVSGICLRYRLFSSNSI